MKHWTIVNIVANKALSEKNTSFSNTGFNPVGKREKYSSCNAKVIKTNLVDSIEHYVEYVFTWMVLLQNRPTLKAPYITNPTKLNDK